MRWVLEQLQKHGLYANLKKYQFHKDEVRFLAFVVLVQGIRMEEERIENVRNWLEPQSVRDIQMFLGFANFYRRFIKNFSRIAAPLTSMLWTTSNNNLGAQTSRHEEEQDATAGAADGGVVDGDENIKNLSTAAKSVKSKKPNFAKANSKQIFLLPKPKRPSYTYERLLPRLRFLGILIQSIIFRLKLMFRDMLLVGF